MYQRNIIIEPYRTNIPNIGIEIHRIIEIDNKRKHLLG